MKEPEKLYIPVPHLRPFWFARWRETDVEYTHTQTFVEKALKWYCLDCECNDNCKLNGKCFFHRQFRSYLEGDEAALPPRIENAVNPDGSTSENYRYRHLLKRVQDTFMEKAENFLYHRLRSENLDCGSVEDFIKIFRKAMEGDQICE